jgi:acetyl-CoA synthetase
MEGHDEDAVFPPPADFASKAHVKSLSEYRDMYARSIEHPQAFWSEIAAQVCM